MVNRTSEYEFTLIVPFFNERDNLHVLEKKLAEYTSRSSKKTCVMLVDDGSIDGSGDAAKEICRRHDNFFMVALERNTGLSGALKAGFDTCLSPLLGYMDADMQTDAEDFEKLLVHASEFELVTGYRVGRQDSLSKKAASRFANLWRRMFTHDGMRDTCCPLKVIRSETAKRLPMFSGMHRFLPALVLLDGGKCKEVPVKHFPRTAGKSKYSVLNRIAGPLADCFVFLWMRRRHISYSIKDPDTV